jgi:predicted DNA-binding protein (MmcQ/YjbR family)
VNEKGRHSGAKRRAPANPLTQLRALCRALPGFHEVEAWGEPTFRVRNKLFATYAGPNNLHGGGRPAVWIKARPENHTVMITLRSDRFFRPPYEGPSGWVGVWLDGEVDWDEVGDLLADGWTLTAPKRLAAARQRSS